MYVTQPVDRVNGHDHLSQVELSHVLSDPVSKLTEQSQQVPPNIVIHHQVLREEGVDRWGKWQRDLLNTGCAKDLQDIFLNYIHLIIGCIPTYQIVVILKGIVQLSDPVSITPQQNLPLLLVTCWLYKTQQKRQLDIKDK